MFCGRYEHNIDSKGRLSIPSEFRDVMCGNNETMFFITKDFVDSCIVAYPYSRWKEFDEKLRVHSVTNTSVKMFLRGLNMWGSRCPMDKQGRILIPPGLRKKTGIDKEVVLVGMSNKIELWNRASVEESVPSDRSALEAINRDIQSISLL